MDKRYKEKEKKPKRRHKKQNPKKQREGKKPKRQHKKQKPIDVLMEECHRSLNCKAKCRQKGPICMCVCICETNEEKNADKHQKLQISNENKNCPGVSL